MTTPITIAIDAMGGDNSPEKTIAGVNYFIKKNSYPFRLLKNQKILEKLKIMKIILDGFMFHNFQKKRLAS